MTPPDDEIAALKTLFGILYKQLRTTSASVEALRVLLLQQGVVSPAEYDALHVTALAEWDRALSAAAAEGAVLALQSWLAGLQSRPH